MASGEVWLWYKSFSVSRISNVLLLTKFNDCLNPSRSSIPFSILDIWI